MAPRTKKGENLDDLFDSEVEEEREVFPTGIGLLDIPLGGGIRAGTLVEAYGPPASGKTSVGYSLIGELQKAGRGQAVLFDVEGSFNSEMAERCGIDEKHLGSDGKTTFKKTGKAEDKIIENLFKKIRTILYNFPDVRFIMVDSVAGLVAEAMTASDANMNRAGMLKAKLLADLIPELQRWIADTGDKCTVYFVNHEKVDVSFSAHGPTKTNTPGGVSLKYLASMRIAFKIAKTENVDVYDPVTDQKAKEIDKLYIRATATKNRYAPPGRPATFIFNLGKGIDRVQSILAHAYGQKLIIKKGGGHYTVPADFSATGEEVSIRSEENVVAYFEEHTEVFDLLEKQVLTDLSTKSAPERIDDPDAPNLLQI